MCMFHNKTEVDEAYKVCYYIPGGDFVRDFPVFDTENGVGSLILKEIPYRQTAYIRIESASDPDAFLKECMDFCRMVGADYIYGSGHEILERYPIYTAIWKLTIPRESLPAVDASLFPVTEQTMDRWQQLYNQKMRNVPCSAYMTRKDMQEMIQKGGGYFVHANGQLLGIGKISGNCLDAVASMLPGAGEKIVSAMAGAIMEDTVTLQVASKNHKALALYQRLGFLKTEELNVWRDLSNKNT